MTMVCSDGNQTEALQENTSKAVQFYMDELRVKWDDKKSRERNKNQSD